MRELRKMPKLSKRIEAGNSAVILCIAADQNKLLSKKSGKLKCKICEDEE